MAYHRGQICITNVSMEVGICFWASSLNLVLDFALTQHRQSLKGCVVMKYQKLLGHVQLPFPAVGLKILDQSILSFSGFHFLDPLSCREYDEHHWLNIVIPENRRRISNNPNFERLMVSSPDMTNIPSLCHHHGSPDTSIFAVCTSLLVIS